MKIEFSLHFGRDSRQPASPFPDRKLTEAALEAIDKATTQRSLKTIENYKTALRAFTRYAGADFPLRQLTADTVEGFAHWLRDQSVCPNTQSCYMRSLRAVLCQIGERSEAERLFSRVFTGNSKTEKRAVLPDDIMRLRTFDLPADSYLSRARDLFLFCFYAQGLPFADAVRLQWSQVSDGSLTYYRRKTGQRVSVALDPLMAEIAERYRQAGSDMLFPCFAPASEHDYLLQLNHYNRALKRLAAMAHIDHKLTSYVARHSWASMAYKASVDLPVISKALGHTNPQTTLIYVKEINDCRLAEANHKLLDSFR